MINLSSSFRGNNSVLALNVLRQTNKIANSCATKDTGRSKMNVPNRKKKVVDSDSVEISDILSKRYKGISIYGAVMLLLAIGIIWTAMLTAEQVQQYHQDYMQLQKMKSEHRKLQIENQRLIIEQQTFSATPQIASRAITELGMYSPTTKDKLILQPTVMPDLSNASMNETLDSVANTEKTDASAVTLSTRNTDTAQQEANND